MIKIRLIKWSMLVLLMCIIIIGYGGMCDSLQKNNSGSSSGTYTISNGTMQGIGSYTGLISAAITSTPNTGPYGTPVTVTITFTSGGSYVNAIKVYQMMPGGSWIDIPNVAPVKQSVNMWVTPSTTSIVLTGNNVWVKFVGVNSDDDEIASGIIKLNNP